MAQQLSKWSHRPNRSAYSLEWKKVPRCAGETLTGPITVKNGVVSGVSFLTASVFECDLSHRRSVAV